MNTTLMGDLDSQPEVTHWTEKITSRSDCAHCGHPRTGNYCSQCGQRFLDSRLKLGALINNLLSRLTAIESGLFHTFWCLSFKPGQVARDYISGRQRPYVNPLTYFFLAATLQIVAFWSVSEILRTELEVQFSQQLGTMDPEARQRAEQLLGSSLHEALADSYISAVSQGYSYLALIFFVLPLAIFLQLLHRSIGERFRLGETVVFSLFTFSQTLLITAAFTPLTIRINSSLQLIVAAITYVGIPQLAHGRFFARSWLSRSVTFISVVVACFPFICSIVGIFLASFAAKLLWASMQDASQ